MNTSAGDDKLQPTTQESPRSKGTEQRARSGVLGLVLGETSIATTFLRSFKPLTDFLQSWGILIIHLVFVALLATCILVWIPDLRVNAVNDRSTTSRQVFVFGDDINTKVLATFSVRDWILPGDITTIVSTGLVFIKLATGSWAGIAAWRCACIMLEKKSLTFSEIKFIVSYKVGVVPREKYSWTTLILLLLLLPAQLSGPLVSGSISWKQSIGFIHSPRDLQVFPSSGGDPMIWREYIEDEDIREEVMSEALSFTWSLYHEALSDVNTACRRQISDKQLKDSSTVNNITIPCLRFDSIVWEQNPPSEQIMSTFQRPYRGALPEPKENTITHPVTGNVGMLDLPQWNGSATYRGSYPTPMIFNEPRLVAFLFKTVLKNQTCPTMYVEKQTGAKSAVFQYDGVAKSGCYTYARVSFSGGVTSSQAKVISPGVVQGSNDAPIVANEFTNEAIFLMNDVMHSMALGDLDQNVSNHTSSLILAMQRSYVACWNSLQYNFGENGGERARNELLGAGATQRIDLLQGVVTYWRVWMWVGLQLLVTVSGILLWYFERIWDVRSKDSRERSFAADALLLDTKDVFEAKDKRRKAREDLEKGVQAPASLNINTPLRVQLVPKPKDDITGPSAGTGPADDDPKPHILQVYRPESPPQPLVVPDLKS